MTTLGERVDLALADAGIDPAELARRAGVTQQAVSQWRSGGIKHVRPRYLFRAARALGVNPEWLGTGDGPMIHGAPSPEIEPDTEPTPSAQHRAEVRLVRAFRLLPPDAQQAMLLVAERLALPLSDEYLSFERQRAVAAAKRRA